MCGGFGPTNISSGASAGWARATLELRKSRQAATRVPVWGTAGRVSTSRVADHVASCRTGLLQEDPSLLLSSSKPVRGSVLARGKRGAHKKEGAIKNKLNIKNLSLGREGDGEGGGVEVGYQAGSSFKEKVGVELEKSHHWTEKKQALAILK
ncbi:hypothetical protein NDU88_002126 [Pleurodeles waltl]|uniref:Uncharacterized protein n=1 Tax=Pleurodeles waltl TaxID=8319 RepID=A0AAV7MQQ8_PLEWA|nr:hypothetical protein NDU88_002126 [Pleurodeles waltl]